jgi:hypothetical protein
MAFWYLTLLFGQAIGDPMLCQYVLELDLARIGLLAKCADPRASSRLGLLSATTLSALPR